MKQYLDLLHYIIDNGDVRADRTGVGTVGVFGYQTKFNLGEGFPLLTTKKVHLKSIIHELLWMLKGDPIGDITYLQKNGVTIWNEWAKFNTYGQHFYLGRTYGAQWRQWNGVVDENGGEDQIRTLINNLKKDPWSRRHIVTAWNPTELDMVELPPCHILFQFHVSVDKMGLPDKLNCQLYQRSADAFLGVPFNIASYSLLTMMVAQVVGLSPGVFTHTFGDLHIYSNHLKQVNEQLKRKPRPLPIMKINPDVKNIDDFKYEDFTLEGYDPWPAIKADIAV